MSDNLALWQAVEKTPPTHVKEITGKSYRGNSPKPHYLIHKATETFGPCGIGWGFNVIDERIEEGAGGEKLHIARVRVWYEWNSKRGEVEHIGGTQFSGTRSSGKPFTDEDAPKKSVTDALVKALSMIGFAGDIFMGRYDDSKYVADLRDEEREHSKQASKKDARPIFTALVEDLRKLTSKEDIRRWIADPDVKARRAQLPPDWDKNLRDEAARHGRDLDAADAFPGDTDVNGAPLPDHLANSHQRPLEH